MGRVSLAMALMVMIITFLSFNTNYCRAATLVKGNDTYRCKDGRLGECFAIADDLSFEFLFDTNVARMLQFDGEDVIGDKTKNPDSPSCSNGQGNPSGTNPKGVCGTPPKEERDCPKYDNNKACPP